ncbi:MAG: glycoside hydrolase family 6 protein [Deltaproteobacteria bacterium]|nr:glycoside hydrolase family 6 protein [Deltaproteobacteria bacterium]
MATPAAAPSAEGEQSATVAPPSGNPFVGSALLFDPEHVGKVEATAATLGSTPLATAVRKAGAFPTAVWFDSIAEVQRAPKWLAEAQTQQTTAGRPVVAVFVVYNLPNRDCAAAASAGELTVDGGGEARYRTEVIDPLAAAFKARPNQKIVLILEPDSLPNIATNMRIAKCAASAPVYKRSIAYAVSKLSAPNVSLYLDAAHAGWLGWEGNRGSIAKIYKDVLADAGGADKIRGFFTNVANYNVLKGAENRKLEPSNPCPDESTYVRELAETLMWAGIKNKGYIIDTSRNGRDGIRSKWGNWCNVNGAGLGERPRIAPTPLVDAYLWVKPPGASDGTSDSKAPRFDATCVSPDAASGAPQAGKWFATYFIDLVKNANPPL